MQKYDVKKPKTYITIKDYFNKLTSKKETKLSLLKVFNSAKIYSKFIDPLKETNPDIRRQLLWLERFEATITYPFLLRIFVSLESGLLNEQVVTDSLRIINSFILRRAVCQEGRPALNKLFIRLTSRFPDRPEVDEWLVTELSNSPRSERWPDDSEFKNTMNNNSLYGKKEARILLERIEAYIAQKEVVDLHDQNITIEHIMPQTLTDEWKKELGDHHENVHQTYLDKIGNLTLTGYNPELSNSDFSVKRQQYANSGIALNRELSNSHSWNANTIIARGKSLAEIAIKIWPRPTN